MPIPQASPLMQPTGCARRGWERLFGLRSGRPPPKRIGPDESTQTGSIYFAGKSSFELCRPYLSPAVDDPFAPRIVPPC